MSRGPGVWQRAVLSACSAERGTWLSVDEISADFFALSVDLEQRSRAGHWRASTLTPAEREGLRRAVRVLTGRGLIESRHENGHLQARQPPDPEKLALVNDILDRLSHGTLAASDALDLLMPSRTL